MDEAVSDCLPGHHNQPKSAKLIMFGQSHTNDHQPPNSRQKNTYHQDWSGELTSWDLGKEESIRD